MSDNSRTAPMPGSLAGPLQDQLDALIERWWADHFPGSAVARDTAAWNVAHAAKERLKRRLRRAQALLQPARDDKISQRSI